MKASTPEPTVEHASEDTLPRASDFAPIPESEVEGRARTEGAARAPIAEAILTLLEKEKTVAEGAGAAPLAALVHRELGLAGQTIVVVVGGGNIDVNVLSRIIDRGLVKSGRIMRARVVLPDRPGSLAQLLAIVAEREANILAIDHDRSAARLEMGQTYVAIEAETRGFEHDDVAHHVAIDVAVGVFA